VVIVDGNLLVSLLVSGLVGGAVGGIGIIALGSGKRTR